MKGTIKNGESREPGNIGHKTQNKDKRNKNTTQKTKRIGNTDITKQPRMNYRDRKVLSVSYKASAVVFIVNPGTSLVGDLGKKNRRKRPIPI